MGSPDSLLAIATLGRLTGPASAKQRHLGLLAGVSEAILQYPSIVVSAYLLDAFREPLAIPSPTAASETQMEMLRDVCPSELSDPQPSRRVVSAWIEYSFLQERLSALNRMQLEAGDLVSRSLLPESQVFEVSSIGEHGVVWLRGRGGRVWPDQIQRHFRANDRSVEAERLRDKARSFAALSSRQSFTSDRASDLRKFRVESRPDEIQLQALLKDLDDATNEAPLQRRFQSDPELLACLLRGPDRFVCPQVQLANRYVADFLIMDDDSTGPRWVLIELETPNSSITIKSSREFDKCTRKGISQIHEWREWLSTNGGIARRPRREDGLGLVGIRAADDAYVIVGRRHLLNAQNSTLRRQIWENDRIRIHTYDWLIEQITGSMASDDAPAFNRYMLPRPKYEQTGWGE